MMNTLTDELFGDEFEGNLEPDRAITVRTAVKEYLSEDPDDGCIRRIKLGDADAFEAVVYRFERPLRAWLATLSPPGVDADEIAQKSFIAAYTRIHEFEEGTNFGAWLFSIARWKLKTETTRLRRVADYHSRYAPDLLQKLHGEAEVEPEHLMTQLGHLKKCMASLSQDLACLLKWRYYDEISLEEMARLSERSVPAVKKQLWKLRRKLQLCVEQRMERTIT
jgi:RNA polymerase sigma-70 factor (ECF subfamily)